MHAPRRPLEVLFLTNFSTACFRAIPALAQMADDLEIQLTILHAYDADVQARPVAEAKLHSFFPEADYYHASRRLLVSGCPVNAVQRFRDSGPLDLVIAPGGDPLGFPRIGRPSLRARLMRETATPVWTMGTGPHVGRLNRRTRNVGCWLDLGGETAHLRAACEYAWAMDATLHVFHVLPDVHEGMLVLPMYSDRPLHAHGLTEAVRALTADLPLTPQVHIAAGANDRAMAACVRRVDADVLFLSPARAVRRSWLGTRVTRFMDAAACPVICVDPASGDLSWTRGRGAWRPAKPTIVSRVPAVAYEA